MTQFIKTDMDSDTKILKFDFIKNMVIVPSVERESETRYDCITDTEEICNSKEKITIFWLKT